ncbi:cell adhesion molecule 3-like isoform X2 [Coregonus clupeaformis]|uniref:cell adhesion molecule 3-like isoform X2 n=1 Tax=Coregonus clupeaformis TaxID=59861 RepID=UPI001E1C5724|nr:cell adhesion molecule 3-like isoform X2 [Coregonus clupeaformis]
MAFPSYLVPSLWTLSLLTLLAASVQSNFVFDDDPLQPVTQDETVSVGGTVTLTCRVAASDNSSLQWSNTAQQTLYFGEKRALRDNRIQLHRSTGTELSITIGDVQLSDEGEYTCSIFTMPVRTARATVTVLGVPGKPQISGYEDTVQEGGKVTLTCTSSGSKPPAKLRWYRDQEELTGRPDVVETNPGEATYTVISELSLTVGRNDDNTLIACAVDHPSLTQGDKRTEQPIRVLFTPDVTIQPESDLPREGEKFIMQCMGNGNPKPTSYVWQKKDGELPPLAKVDGSFLRFEMLNKSDNGVYLCQADNGIGKMQGEYTLLVQDDSNNLFPTSFYLPSSSPTSDSPTPSLSPDSFSPMSTPSGSASASLPASSPHTIFSFSIPYPSDLTIAPSSSSSSLSSSSPSPSPPAVNVLSISLSLTPSPPSVNVLSTSLSNSLFPDLSMSPDPHPPSSSSDSSAPSSSPPPPSVAPPSSDSLTPSSVTIRLNGVYSFTDGPDNIADPTAMSTSSGVDHAVIGGVVAVIVFILICLLMVLGRYLIRHKGTYLTHEAKGCDDAPDADTAIINAEGGHSGAEDKKEYFI